MAGHHNENKRYFELRKIESDMKEAAEKGPPILAKKDVLSNRITFWLSVVILGLLVTWLCFVLGVF
ncbi:hypothetical protein [Rhizobium rhizophilum]|uniref:Aa3-type cytochrome c oxidase subunit IV n=1 Tax=Rhizobium rhizophilum TaxID=1850373 RepID=A0ABY2R0C5_9HYPH|nr:hypothetical protein [Rhizobium rhizophilum]THV17133.1 hypothetical protein E9677_03860 [Rhizobium rhizophilum]